MARVTILMPAYNVEKYIFDAIDSILNQTFKDYELLILDDCSTDNTANVVEAISDYRIRYVRNEKNLGLAENLNKGIDLARTEFIARMDGDDISVSTCLQKQIDFLDSHPEVGICSVGFQYFGTKNSKVIFPEYNKDIKIQMLFGCTIIVPMFRKEIITKNALRYKTTAFPAEDYRMWAECLQITQIYNIQEILFHYRMHSEQISTSRQIIQIQKSNEVRLYMLNWLNPNINEDEKGFFLDVFVPGIINKQSDYKTLQIFAKKLENYNNIYANFDSKCLHNKLQQHIKISMYNFVLNSFFKKKFTPISFLIFIFKGYLFMIPAKQSFKIIAKCFLFREI